MNLQVCTGENNAGDRTGSWGHTVILAQTSIIPRLPINGVITVLVPLFKDTYGHQNRDITSINSCQIAF